MFCHGQKFISALKEISVLNARKGHMFDVKVCAHYTNDALENAMFLKFVC